MSAMSASYGEPRSTGRLPPWTGRRIRTRCAAASRWSRGRPAVPGAASPPRSARPARPSSAPAAAADARRSAPTTTAPRRSRRRPSSSPQLGGTGIAIAGRPPRPRRRSRRLADADPRATTAASTCSSTTSGAARCSRAARPTGTRRSGSTTSTTGLRILRLGDRHPPHHVAPPAAAARSSGPVACSSRSPTAPTAYNAVALPDLGLLRPRQGRGEPARVLAGPRARAARGDGGRDHAGLAALGDDARRLRRRPRSDWRTLVAR